MQSKLKTFDCPYYVIKIEKILIARITQSFYNSTKAFDFRKDSKDMTYTKHEICACK